MVTRVSKTVLLVALLVAAAVAVDAILPDNPNKDSQGRNIKDKVYFSYGATGWHGTLTAPEKFFQAQEWGRRPLWLADSSSSALVVPLLGNKMNELRHKNFSMHMYLFKITSSQPLLNLPHRSAAENAKILKPYNNGEPAFTMGVGSHVVLNHLIPNLCEKHPGWRSPWDQNEFMICAKEVKRLELVAILKCNIDGFAKETRYGHKNGSVSNRAFLEKDRAFYDPNLVDSAHTKNLTVMDLKRHCTYIKPTAEVVGNKFVKIHRGEWKFANQFLSRRKFDKLVDQVGTRLKQERARQELQKEQQPKEQQPKQQEQQMVGQPKNDKQVRTRNAGFAAKLEQH